MRSASVYSVIGHSVIRPAQAAVACLVASLAAAPSPAQAQDVCLTVNGEAITNDDIEQRTTFNLLANHKSLQREEIIEELIDDQLKVQTARRNGIDLTDKDVDRQYADMAKRMHLNADELTNVLGQNGVRATTLKAKILTDMSWQYVIRGKFKPELQFDEKSVNNEIESEKGAGDEVGYDYTLRQIVFPAPSGNAPLMEARRNDADALRARFASCESGLPDAQAQHDVIIREPITKNSFDFPPALREILDKTGVGHLTPPETTEQGVEVVAVCDRKETKGGPAVIRHATEKLFAKKFLALSTSYLRDLRHEAKIERMPQCDNR